MPIIQHLHLLLRQITIIRRRILRLETRFAQRPRGILAREEVVRPAGTVCVAFVCDVEYCACGAVSEHVEVEWCERKVNGERGRGGKEGGGVGEDVPLMAR